MKPRLITIFSTLLLLSLACGVSSEAGAPTETPLTPAGRVTITEPPAPSGIAPGVKPPTSSTPLPPSPEIAKDQTWLVMLYQDADDEILEQDIFTDLNEAERVGSTDNVKIVAQMDRYEGGFDGDGDWTTAKRFYLTQDDDLEHIASKELADLGEVNMADGDTLTGFVTWAVKSYPADKYVLILSDHGSGWPGGWSDPQPKNKTRNILIDGFDDMLYLNELGGALKDIKAQTGIDSFELIGMDACLMGHIEVMAALQPYARYSVLSQETEPSMGWAYTAFLEQLVKNPRSGGDELAKTIVKSYIDQDMLIVDDKARARYLEQNYETNEDPGATALAKEESSAVTLTAVDLGKLPALLKALDDLSASMVKINQKVVARARSHTLAFDTVFGDEFPSPYIDLGHFAKLIKKESTSENVGKAADAVRAAIKDVVLAEKHGPDKKGATGISIYFPTTKLFASEGSDYATYTQIAGQFAAESLWPDFLSFHYTGQPLAKNNKPEQGTRLKGPGAGKIVIDPLKLSARIATKEKPSTITTQVKGENVAYIYVFTGHLDKKTGAIHVLDLDYLDPEATKEVDGKIYPDWGSESVIEVEFDWDPVAFMVSDGKAEYLTLLNPQAFGATLEETVYTVDGNYTFKGSGDQRFARLYFDGNGDLTQVMVYNGSEAKGPLHEVRPEKGDTFTIFDQWIEPGQGKETSYTPHEGGTLTFGKTRFLWDLADAPAGDYVVGLIAEDMDGNIYEQYANLKAQ